MKNLYLTIQQDLRLQRLVQFMFEQQDITIISLNSSRYKDKYPLLRSGEKIRFYFVATKNSMENNVFGYSQGSFPYEFAPPVDYDEQFTKTILDPINRFIETMGHHPISPNLFMINPLF
jgi:hypothetical protein